MRRQRLFYFRTTILLAALAASVAACSSDPTHKPGAMGPDTATGGSAMSGGGTSSTTGGQPEVPGQTVDGLALPSGSTPIAHLHRLTTSELQNSLKDLLGDDVPLKEVEPDNVVDGFASIGAGVVAVSPAGVGQYETAARAATDFVFADATRLATRLACAPQAAADACIAKTIGSFGRRAFRRPLTDAELTRLTTLATTVAGKEGNTPSAGLRSALNAILQSPSFLYRVELGAPSAADGGRLKYTDFEMASRLAAILWDSVPDDALLDAAQAGMLATVDGIKTQAARLLADPKAHRAIRAFTDELFGMSRFGEAVKDPALFPTWTDDLKPAMLQELELKVEDMVFSQKGDFFSLYDDRVTFLNHQLAKFYGLPDVQGEGFIRTQLPADSPRVGLLGTGAVLAGHALPQRTSPTQRGKFIAESLLCRTVPAPPNNVPPLPAMPLPGQTLRQRLEEHRSSPACSGCHALMDPYGFGMEDFDGVGLYRTMDSGSPLDSTGTFTGPGLDGSAFKGLAELGAALRKQPVLGPCMVSKLYAESQGRTATELDRATINQLSTGFATGHQVDQLILAMVQSESFRFVEPSKG